MPGQLDSLRQLIRHCDAEAGEFVAFIVAIASIPSAPRRVSLPCTTRCTPTKSIMAAQRGLAVDAVLAMAKDLVALMYPVTARSLCRAEGGRWLAGIAAIFLALLERLFFRTFF